MTDSTVQVSPLRLIMRNARYLVSNMVVLQILQLLSGMILTRYLQASGYGHYAFSYVFSWFLMLLVMLGTKGVILRDVPRHPERAGFYLVQVTLLRSVLSIGVVILTVVASQWLDQPPEVQAAMVVFMLVSAMDALSLTFQDVFRSLEDMSKEGYIYVTERVAVVIGYGIAAHFHWSMVAIVQMMLAVTMLRTLGWLWPVTRTITLPRVTVDWPFWGYLCREGWQFLRVEAAAAAVQRMDVLMLGALAVAADVGRYNAAYTVYLVAGTVPQILATAMQPTSVRLAHQASADLLPIQVLVSRWSLMVMMPLIMMIGILAPTIMATLFGVTFLPAGEILRWLMLAFPTLILMGVILNHLFATNRQLTIFYVVCLNAVINIALNAALIPRFGAFGAVSATVASETVALVVALVITWRTVGRILWLAAYPVWGLGIFLYATAVAGAHLIGWLSLPICLVAYGTVLWATGLVSGDEVRALRRQLRPTD